MTARKRKPRMESRKPKNVRNYVMWLLGRREHSEHELRQRLKQRGCEPHEIDDAIEFVKSYGFQSDERFAAMKARSEARRRGNRRIKSALAAKGIAEEQIEEQIAQLEPEPDRAIAAVSRFEGQPLDQKLRAKIWHYLRYRGFGSDAIRAAVAHLEDKLKQEDVEGP